MAGVIGLVPTTSAQSHSHDPVSPLIVRARPTGPRFARPEDRLLCRAPTESGKPHAASRLWPAEPGHKRLSESSV
jgi:hypothetical protein